MTTSIFEGFRPAAYPYRFDVELVIGTLAGGTPTDPKVAEGWLKTKLGLDPGDLLRDEVAKVMVERGVTDMDEAVGAVVADKHLNGFRRMESGELFIEGRQVKAMVKEAANIRWPKDRWGPSSKGTRSFFAEHFFIAENRIGLGVTEPTAIEQRFVHTWRGNGIQYEETVTDAHVAFTLYCDYDLDAETKNCKKGEGWALFWLTAESNGLGASRSQGYGTFAVTKFERQS